MDVVVSFLVRSGQRRMVNSVAKSHVEKTLSPPLKKHFP